MIKLDEDIKAGLLFESSIPQGYGIGSSGALCASIFSKYSTVFDRTTSIDENKLKYLQDIMALMESFYHGTSSGLDPLISYVNRPIYLQGRNKKEVLDGVPESLLHHFSLVDTGISRKPSPFVHDYMKRVQEGKISEQKLTDFKEMVNLAIQSFLANDLESVGTQMRKISKWEYLNFSKMIPDNFKEMWLEGLESGRYSMKLCGAGGGGFLIKFSQNINELAGEISIN